MSRSTTPPDAGESNPKATVVRRLSETGLATDRFIDVENGGKKSTDHTQVEASNVSGNYGVYAGRELVLIDIDDYDGSHDLGPINGLQDTLTVGTPNGGDHRYYHVPNAVDVFEDSFGVKNPVTEWGEIRVHNQYVVGPGSTNPDGDVRDEYVITDNHPIAQISAHVLVGAIRATGYDTTDDATGGADANVTPPGGDVDLSDRELLEKARDADNGDRFDALWRGDTAGYPSHSEADMALCNLLAFWTGGDRQRMDRLFRESGLMRDKWDEDRGADTYGERTIEAALDATTDYYDPSGGTATPTRPDPSERVGSPSLCPSDLQAWAGLGEDDSIADLNDRQKAAYVWELVKASDECHVRVSRENGELWAFDPERGTWNTDGERALAQAARRTLGAVNYGGNVLEELKNQARADPAVEVSTDTFGLEPGTVAVKNGLLDLRKAARDDPDALRELRPDDYAQTRLPVDHDPDASGEWKPFVGDVVENEMIDAVQEYIGYCLHREATFERALLLVGGGANGKSTFLETIGALLGDENTTNISPYDFGDKPTKAELHGGLANIAADLSSGSIRGRSLGEFKKLTGGDAVTAKRLYKDPFKFTYTGGMLFAANEVPDVPVSDDDTAFWRRWIIVQFDNYFPEGSDRRDPMLGERLQQPENLSAVLNWAIEGWARLMERGEFTNVPGSPDDTRRKWQTWGDSLDYFLSNVAEHDPDAPNITTGEAWNVYRRWCRENGEDPVGQNKFTNAARDSGADLGYVSSVRTDRHTTPRRGYKNFGTVDDETDPIDVITESDDNDDDDPDTDATGLSDFETPDADGESAGEGTDDNDNDDSDGDGGVNDDADGVGYPSLLTDLQEQYSDGDELTASDVAEAVGKSETYVELGLAWVCDDFDGDVLTRESEGVYQFHG